jgi:hypothetical protein
MSFLGLAMHQRGLKTREKVPGREHPDTFINVSNIGNVLGSQGKYAEVEVMLRRDHMSKFFVSSRRIGSKHYDEIPSTYLLQVLGIVRCIGLLVSTICTRMNTIVRTMIAPHLRESMKSGKSQ